MSFPITFPVSWPDGPTVPDRLAGDYSVEIVLDHCEQGIDRLIQQYKGLPRTEAILCAVLDQVQDIENAAHDLLRADTLETGLDDQIDRDGRLVGAILRGGLSVDRYRLIVKAEILVRKSSGHPEEILKILQILFPSGSAQTFALREMFPASFEVDLFDVIDDTEAEVTHRLIFRAKDVGVRYQTIWSTEPPGTTFRFSASIGTEETGSPYGFDVGLMAGVFDG